MLQHGQLGGQYQIKVHRDGPLDHMEVLCEMQPQFGLPSEHDAQRIGRALEHRIKTLVGVSTRVTVLAHDSIERTLVGKARRVRDLRSR